MKVPKARKLKSGTWFIQLRLGGESIPVTAKTERECVKQAEYVKSQYRVGKREKPEELVPEASELEKLPTLEDAIDNYISKRDGILSPSTIAGYKVIKRNRFKGIMKTSLSDISDDDLAAAFNAEAKIISGKTLKNSWGFIQTVLKEEAHRDPPKVKMPQIVPADKLFLSPDQIKTFIQGAKGNKAEIPALLALCGLRKSEILALKWENIDLENKIIHVRGAAVLNEHHKLVQKKENKNRTSTRNVPIMIDELYDALKAAPKKDGLIVECAQNTLYSRINRICEKNGLPKVGVHGLRHSFASLAYHLGVPERITMELGGWANNQTMHKIYIHIAQADVTKYATEMTNFFKGS